MDDEEVNPLGTPTSNYGWTKPTVGGDLDVWGGYLNTDLDGIDSTVFALSTNFSATAPAMDGTAAAGVATTFAHSDHVHPTDTSRYAASNPAGYVTSAGAASAAPVQSFNTRTGAIALLSGDVTGALGFTPYSNANPANYITAAGAPVQSFNTRTGAVSLTLADVTGVGGAPLASPAFSGTPTLPTGTTGITQISTDSSTKLATTAFVGAAVTGGAYTLPQATTTVLGGVKVDGTTITASAGVISAAASTPTNPNRIDNGDMYVNQRGLSVGSGTAATAGGWYLDRWSLIFVKTTKWNCGVNYPYSPPAGFEYCLGVQTLTGVAAAAADYNFIQQGIEWDAIADFQWGTAGAQPITISFWVISSLTGTFSFAILSGGSTYRIYLTTYSIPTANTWTKITLTIPGDTNAIWAPGDILYVSFDLGSGSNYNSATINAWQSSTAALRYTSAVNVSNTSGAKFALTGVKLELGSVATPFVFDHPAVKLARCQRYLKVFDFLLVGGYAPAGNPVYGNHSYAAMRAGPTVTFSGINYTNASALTLGYAGPQIMYETATITAAGVGNASAAAVLSAEI